MLLLRRCHSLTQFGPLNAQRYSTVTKWSSVTRITLGILYASIYFVYHSVKICVV